MNGLTDFYQVLADPGAYARELKQQGRTIIGYFCSYTPEEIILAAGAHPLRLFGTKGDISLADAHLQAYSCSLVRGALEEALAGRLEFLDGTVFPHTCDSIQRLSDIWRLNTKFKFFADVVLPVKLNTPAAREYMADVLEKFRRELGRGLGRVISDDDLTRAMATYNRIRDALKTIYDLRCQDPGLIKGADLAAIVKASMIMDRNYLVERLPQIIEDIREGKLAWNANGKKRLVLVGGICDQPDIYQMIEETGGAVVADDLCTGSRWIHGTLAGPDPIKALAERYTHRPICPAKHASDTFRGDNLVALAKESRADGVIFLLLKFCDPHSFDYPFMKEFLDREKIPGLLYEIEDQIPSEGQLRTRFETFIEML
ncbi:MAG: 2-hydroxyacyl-CoA dehydratase family protein [Pseudomonadota bacterium]